MRKLSIAAYVLLLFMVGCSSEPQKAGETSAAKPKTTETETGREAFQKEYVQAHLWAPDAKAFRLESEVTTDATGQDGKAAIWRGFFASESRRKQRFWTWSGTSAEGAPERGVTANVEDTYNAGASNRTWDFAFLKTDSDKAYEVAQKHGGEKLVKADAKQPVKYILDWNPNENVLVWHVIYGNNMNDAKLRIAVNGSTGEFIRTEK